MRYTLVVLFLTIAGCGSASTPDGTCQWRGVSRAAGETFVEPRVGTCMCEPKRGIVCRSEACAAPGAGSGDGVTCTADGKVYRSCEMYAPDRCNICSCGAGGVNPGCTLVACAE